MASPVFNSDLITLEPLGLPTIGASPENQQPGGSQAFCVVVGKSFLTCPAFTGLGLSLCKTKGLGKWTTPFL